MDCRHCVKVDRSAHAPELISARRYDRMSRQRWQITPMITDGRTAFDDVTESGGQEQQAQQLCLSNPMELTHRGDVDFGTAITMATMAWWCLLAQLPMRPQPVQLLRVAPELSLRFQQTCYQQALTGRRRVPQSSCQK